MHDDGGEAQMPKKHAISSRWLDEEPEEEPAPTSEPMKVRHIATPVPLSRAQILTQPCGS